MEMRQLRDEIFECAINEGDIYRTWINMATENKAPAKWLAAAHLYYLRLLAEDRCDFCTDELEIAHASRMIREYYLQHITEM